MGSSSFALWGAFALLAARDQLSAFPSRPQAPQSQQSQSFSESPAQSALPPESPRDPPPVAATQQRSSAPPIDDGDPDFDEVSAPENGRPLFPAAAF